MVPLRGPLKRVCLVLPVVWVIVGRKKPTNIQDEGNLTHQCCQQTPMQSYQIHPRPLPTPFLTLVSLCGHKPWSRLLIFPPCWCDARSNHRQLRTTRDPPPAPFHWLVLPAELQPDGHMRWKFLNLWRKQQTQWDTWTHNSYWECLTSPHLKWTDGNTQQRTIIERKRKPILDGPGLSWSVIQQLSQSLVITESQVFETRHQIWRDDKKWIGSNNL